MRRFVVVAIVAFSLAGVASAHPRHWHWGVYWWPWWSWGPWPTSVAVTVPPDLAVVDTDVVPEDARVYLDGKLIGTADDFDGYPSYLFLEPGTYELEFSLPGYVAEKVVIEARGGRYFSLDNRLERQPGEQRPAFYERPKGLPSGRVFAKEGGAPARKSGPDLSLRPDLRSRRQVARESPAASAALKLTIEPPEASVYLDGEFLGTGRELGGLAAGLAVAAGSHTLEVFAPGRVPRQVEVEVAEGQVQELVVALEARDPDD
ncbi:MAG: PEGA domain-containing protein [Thermoanaerobaculaceae bacterium]|nr:PEGA domain-containing protein [Thermoanaerobaculaceae bacterium]